MRVLLVDHDSEGLEAIARAIRGVLELDCVTSKGDALLLLRQNTYDVLIACERAVDGSGLDLLGRTTRTAVPLKRIFAAAPERLQLLGPRLAPFKVQRTINYPIDLEELWLAIAQVTGGPDDETDGTIERVVLDERGIPSAGTVPRAPIPPRPPSPLSGLPPAPVPAAPTPISAALSSGRAAAAAAVQMAQPAPEPPLRAPPPPRAPPQIARPAPPASTSDTGRMRAPAAPANTSDTGRMRVPAPPATSSETGRMRALAQPMQPIPPMPMPPPMAPIAAPAQVSTVDLLPGWTPELPPEDDFAQVAAQARLGVQQKTVDEAGRRKRLRLLTACGIALVVAGGIVFLIEKFYDPAARAREQAIAATVAQMAEQQKATDDLTLIEIDIENAIMNNDIPAARREFAKLVEKSPAHPRREFLEKSIDRAAELARLSPQSPPPGPSAPMQPPSQAAVVAAPTSAPRSLTQSRPRTQERAPERTPERVVAKAPERSAPPRSQREAPNNPSRTFGTPIGDAPREATIPLDAPINAPPSTAARRTETSFSGRTVEAGDGSGMRTPAAAPHAAVPSPSQSGSAAVAMPSAAAPAPAPPASVDVVPAKVVKRVAPVAPLGVSRKTSGFVVVKFNINENGRVSDVAVVESTPPGVFDEVAQSAVRKWIYEPRKENGVAVTSQAKARLVFEAAD